MTATRERITPDDIRAKFDEIQGGVETRAEAARSTAATVGAVVAVAAVVVVFYLGVRRGKKRTTVVEIRRV